VHDRWHRPATLDGREHVDGAKLGHAYGPASDVPELLQRLRSDEEATREAAIYELHGNIWHQGTVYERNGTTTGRRARIRSNATA